MLLHLIPPPTNTLHLLWFHLLQAIHFCCLLSCLLLFSLFFSFFNVGSFQVSKAFQALRSYSKWYMFQALLFSLCFHFKSKLYILHHLVWPHMNFIISFRTVCFIFELKLTLYNKQNLRNERIKVKGFPSCKKCRECFGVESSLDCWCCSVWWIWALVLVDHCCIKSK